MLYLFSEARQFLHENILKNQYCCCHCKKYLNKSEFKFVKETGRFIDNYHGELEAEGVFVYSYCPKCNTKTREWIESRKVIRWL